MSHFAKVVNGIVEQVIVVEQDVIDSGAFGNPEQWVQTSYNTYHNQHRMGGTALRGNYAGPGHVYDSANDVFYPAQPYASWQLNTTTWTWIAPVPAPEDGHQYTWNEQEQQWVQGPILGQ